MADDANQPQGVTIDRSGDVPKRTDTRSVMRQLHDELASHYAAKERRVGVNGQGLDEAVDEAVKGAPAPGSEEY